ncbi:MAG: hypothetical protein KDD40_07025 [Bdellovibrionales bacterium]|nr:hypothetical protein [Bdellovibrionales bacterium]
MQKWRVELDEKAKFELMELKKSGELSQGDIEVLRKWVSEIEEGGFDAIKNSPFWNDHPLHSDWEGHRSSSFSYKGRIIYKVIDNKILVMVVRITVDHDYRR